MLMPVFVNILSKPKKKKEKGNTEHDVRYERHGNDKI